MRHALTWSEAAAVYRDCASPAEQLGGVYELVVDYDTICGWVAFRIECIARQHPRSARPPRMLENA
jgi:hypothetical protein